MSRVGSSNAKPAHCPAYVEHAFVEHICTTLFGVTEISVRALNQETSKVLARVKSGEEITVTERGAVIARIVSASAGPLDDLISAGRVRPASVHGLAPRPTIRKFRSDQEAGALLQGMRDDQRY